MARVDPIPPTEWPREMRDALAALAPPVPLHPPMSKKGGPKGLNALGTFAHHPELARAFFTFNGYTLRGARLTERQREILMLRVSAVRKSSYQWAQHLVVARDIGMTDEEIERIAADPDPGFWNPLETALLKATDELLGDGTISDETWAALSAELDTQQLMDVIFSVSAFETAARLFRSFAIELDDDLRQLVGDD
ncbi:carboxymuconolactone decarboxylase family protein [Yinghuangia sp. YIM S10712]|uniref:carboxymuconolactone decarboxylase family protein n=1 Tax=Yinghuangia sp. YIM S10712 TaxID=3436930 RepID=UPI003F5378EC